MKFTLSWLKTYLDTDVDLFTISETLTAIGLEVEEVIDPTEGLKPFIIAKIERQNNTLMLINSEFVQLITEMK